MFTIIPTKKNPNPNPNPDPNLNTNQFRNKKRMGLIKLMAKTLGHLPKSILKIQNLNLKDTKNINKTIVIQLAHLKNLIR